MTATKKRSCIVPMCHNTLASMPNRHQFDASTGTVQFAAQRLEFAVVDGVRVAPDWIPLIPGGAVVIARDGRTFVPDHATVISNFVAQGMPLPLDWDHALNHHEKSSPAAAWVDALEVRDGALWGRIEFWTPKGKESVESGEYRFISPTMSIDPDTLRVVDLWNASLVNDPALIMPSLFAREKGKIPMKKTIVDLLQAFGLDPESATDAQISDVKATYEKGLTPSEEPSLDSHVPVEQYEALVAELAVLKAQVAQHEEEALGAKVDAVISAALQNGTLLPSERAFFEASARKDLQAVVDLFSKRKPMAGGPAKNRVPASTNSEGLSEKELAMAKAANITPAAFAAAKNRIVKG